MQDTTKSSFVYLMRAGNTSFYKIGVTDYPEQRRAGVQTGNMHGIKIVAYWRGDRKQERRLHAALARYRKRGEWFKLPELLVEGLLAGQETERVQVDMLPVEKKPESVVRANLLPKRQLSYRGNVALLNDLMSVVPPPPDLKFWRIEKQGHGRYHWRFRFGAVRYAVPFSGTKDEADEFYKEQRGKGKRLASMIEGNDVRDILQRAGIILGKPQP